MAYSPIQTITIAFVSYQKGIGMLKRVFDVIDLGTENKSHMTGKTIKTGDIYRSTNRRNHLRFFKALKNKIHDHHDCPQKISRFNCGSCY
ncbi:MAG: hypothetical protein ACOC4J_01175 [Bacteroidota bacterium]